MNFLTTEGPTILIAKAPSTDFDILISILSLRAALFLLCQSDRGKWKKPIVHCGKWHINDGYNRYDVLGFQPSTGLHIAVKARSSHEIKKMIFRYKKNECEWMKE